MFKTPYSIKKSKHKHGKHQHDKKKKHKKSKAQYKDTNIDKAELILLYFSTQQYDQFISAMGETTLSISGPPKIPYVGTYVGANQLSQFLLNLGKILKIDTFNIIDIYENQVKTQVLAKCNANFLIRCEPQVPEPFPQSAPVTNNTLFFEFIFNSQGNLLKLNMFSDNSDILYFLAACGH